MKYVLMIVTALFPFLHEMRYEVQLVDCNEKQILVKANDEVMEIRLFNVMISEKGNKQICPLLKAAKVLEVEVDPSSALESPLDVYLFVDDMLLQQYLLEQEVATIAIHNPEYRYSKKMEAASKTKETMTSVEKEVHLANHTRGTWIIAIFSVIWVIFCIIFFRKFRYHTLNR